MFGIRHLKSASTHFHSVFNKPFFFQKVLRSFGRLYFSVVLFALKSYYSIGTIIRILLLFFSYVFDCSVVRCTKAAFALHLPPFHIEMNVRIAKGQTNDYFPFAVMYFVMCSYVHSLRKSYYGRRWCLWQR